MGPAYALLQATLPIHIPPPLCEKRRVWLDWENFAKLEITLTNKQVCYVGVALARDRWLLIS